MSETSHCSLVATSADELVKTLCRRGSLSRSISDMKRHVATAMLCVLLVAACNSSDDTADPAPTATATTAATSATTTTTPAVPTKAAAAKPAKPAIKKLSTAGRQCTVLEEPLRQFPGHNLSMANRGQHLTEVREMQSMVNGAGDGTTCIPEDGDFGPVTKQAVVRFQTQQGLVVDGLVGEQTWTQLNLILSH